MTLRQYIFGLGLVSITLISTTIMARSQILGFEWSSTYTNWGHIVSLETGWSEDTMSIVLDPSVPFVNSTRLLVTGGFEQCHFSSGNYALDPKDPGVKVHEAALLSAFVAHKKVRLLISDCAFSKPRVIAVGLMD